MSEIKLPVLKIEMKLFDKDGNIIKHFPSRPSHSWVRNHYVLLFCQAVATPCNVANNLNIVDVDGDSHSSTSYNAQSVYLNAAVGDTTQGIVIGSGSTAEAFADYALDTQIAHGTAGGELQYSAQVEGGYALNVLDRIITHTRSFVNDSGGNVTVAEIGIVMAYAAVSALSDDYLLARDVLDSAITIANSETLGVNYTMTLTYPE